MPDAVQLAEDDKYQFQSWPWALLVRVLRTSRKGADKGIDGNLYFHDDPKGKTKRIILSVKGGDNVSVTMVRDLVGTVQRENADLGVLISLCRRDRPDVERSGWRWLLYITDGRQAPENSDFDD